MKNKFEIWDEYIDPRIRSLKQHNFNLESFYLYSAVIEFILQEAINYQEDWIQNILKKSKLKIQKTQKNTLESKTLGELIKLFASYSEDAKLISKLNEFNSLRKRIVHHLMDHPLTEVDKEAKKSTVLYHELVQKLCIYNFEMTKKIISSIKIKRKKILKKLKQ